MKPAIILLTGACGQLGTVLTEKLQEKYGLQNVIASDIREHTTYKGIYEILDVTNLEALKTIILKYQVTQIFHLAAILSAKGESKPLKTWNINMTSFLNVLEVSRLHSIKKVFFPSSIAVFGNNIERIKTPQSPNLTPTTVYGISKVTGENWANYYYIKYGLDVRSIRYPGIIGYQSLPSGGTTDYAVTIFHKAIKNEIFNCYLDASTVLPMIYMEDAIRATIELMDAPKENISIRTSYNISGMSFNPQELATAIQEFIPGFKIEYKPDYRQKIANTWPQSIDDRYAKTDWNWRPKYDLNRMTEMMLKKLKKQ